jgi:hypothetical protein
MMKKLCVLAVAAFGWLLTDAQQLPVPSPGAKVKQTVGLTEFEVEYARPSMRGRTIFGDLVPFDEVWRTGANVATKVTFSTDITFGSTPVGAGTYSLFTIPGKDSWTVILNKEIDSWGTGNYKEEMDVARVIAKSEPHASTETFEISFEGISKDGAFLTLKWEKTAVRVPIKVEVDAQAEANIQKAIAEKPQDANVYRNAANYYMQNKIKLDVAETYMAKSLELNSTSWYSHYLYAQILSENAKTKEAIAAANMSLFLGQQAAAESGKAFVYEKLVSDMITGMGGKVKAPKMPKKKK